MHHAYAYAGKPLGSQNVYLEEMDKNVRYAQVTTADIGRDPLRRTLPITLPPRARAYPEHLVIP